MAIVTGFIFTETGDPAIGATVRAFDKDLRHEQLLGEVVITETSGRYQITYTAEQFRRAEKRSADLGVRALVNGIVRAESPILFNASENVRIDLTLEPLPVVETPRLSELERLQQSIEPVRENVAYAAFTDDEIDGLLTEEIIRTGSLGVSERRMVRQQLGFLRRADQHGRQTDIPIAAFYGWFREDQPQVLVELLDVPARTLRAALEAAIRGSIIPDITAELAEILERVGSLRFEQGRRVNHRFVVQLINAETSRPLAGYAVAVRDPRAEPEDQELGTLFADGRGACVIVFSLPGDAPANATRRLELRISDEGVEVAEAVVEARANQEEVATLRVRLRENETGDVPIEDFAPPGLVGRLRQRGIRNLQDVLAHPDMVDEDDPEGLERLRATAKFAVLAPELGAAEREHLLNRGNRSLLDVAATSRAEFVRDHHEGLGGDAAAFTTYFAAREEAKVLYHMINSAWLKSVTTPGDDPPDPDIPTGVNDVLSAFKKCGCKDCDSAVSPTAYLAHLLQWTLEHIKDGTASIAFSQLEEEFHQPFGDLPASCSAVEAQVPQVRICVELLWRFTGFLTREDLQLPTPFRNAYRHLRNQLYRLILNNLGTSFEQLRTAALQIEGDDLVAQQVAAQRQALVDLLGIDGTHLNELFVNIEQPPVSPSEVELEGLFGFKSTRAEDVFAAPETPDLITWQRERLESIWQSQDWSTDAYSGEARLPFVDPALIDESHLRAPLTENSAFTLLEARREALAAHRQALVGQNPQENGLATLLESELGEDMGQLRASYEALQASDQPEAAAQAQQTIAALNLTVAGFIHLMTIDARVQAGEPVGLTPAEIDAAWEAVFDILSRAHRFALFPAWVAEENDLDLVCGPKLFWFSIAPPAPASAWLATPAERTEWEEALRRRSRPPIIDPDQIPSNYVIVMALFAGPADQGNALSLVAAQPPLTAMSLWQQRRAWVDGRLEALRAARENQPTPLATLQAVLSASSLGVGLDAFAELANMEGEGHDLTPRLSQLSLTKAEYRFLAEIRQLALGNASVPSDKFGAVDAVLVRAGKRRESAEWRLAEQEAEIALDPHRFVAQKDSQPADDSPQVDWLHDPIALQQWVATLEARGDQLKALSDGLAQAVGNAAEQVLPLMRNILIVQTVAPGDGLVEKADWLDKRLLIDMRTDGCHLTTRVSQAIETLQRFIRGVYTEEHPPLMQHLTLDAEEDYEAEWPVLGSYATWRAFMLAYLFPENLLHVSPPSRQSFGFAQLKNNLSSRIEPPAACAAAREYSGYFQDVFDLDVQASCQVRTRVDRAEGCSATTAALHSRVHVFALATTRGKIYTNSFDSYLGSNDTLETWQPVPQLSDVLEIIGAVPHETPTQQRFVLLFVKAREASKSRLRFVALDLDDTHSWASAKPKELDPPPGAENDFSAVVVQKRHTSVGDTLGLAPAENSPTTDDVPTILAIRAPSGRVYVGNLNAQGTDWAGEGWIPLFGDIKAQLHTKLCGLIQRSSHEYAMILQERDGWLRYRLFSVEPVISRDDGFWRAIAKGDYRGAFAWPGTPDVFVFYQAPGGARYRIIRETAAWVPTGWPNSSMGVLESWLGSVVGVTLKSYPLDIPTRALLVDWPVQDTEGANCHYIDEEVPVHYVGSLYDLLALTEGTWDWALPDLNGVEVSCLKRPQSEYRRRILESLQSIGRQRFEQTLEQASTASFQDSELGAWKLADWYVRQFAESIFQVEVSLLTAVTNASFGDDSVTFRLRGSELSDAALAPRQLQFVRRIVPPGGDEEFGPDPEKAIVFQTQEGAFRFKLRRSGSHLHEASSRRRVTPVGDGPFDLTPLETKRDLQLRRDEIRAMYEGLESQASLRMYLIEAYRLVPIFLGSGLQRDGYFEEALLWYRQVYDYRQPKAKRKIDHGLKLEEALGLSYENVEEWLNDASNAHGIAATRENTYARHTLLTIIRCLIDYADALFSRDNVTDNARARELYTMALTLLDVEELKVGSSACPDIIGELEINVTETTLALPQFQAVLAQLSDPDRLRSAVDALTSISRDTSRPAVDRLADMRESVLTAVNDIPAPARMTDVVQTKRRTVATLENHVLADQSSRMLLTKTHQRRRQVTLTNLAEVTDRSELALLDAATELPWLRQARAADRVAAPDEPLDLALFNPSGSGRLAVLGQIKSAFPMASLAATHSSSFAMSAGMSFDFCVPQNPVVQALRARAENNLNKLRTCRNIAGFVRQVDPYGVPIGIGSGMVSPDGSMFSGIVDAPPTAYRYKALIDRAKELVGISHGIEADYRTALESAEREALTLMQAEQSVGLAQARVSLQDVRAIQANSELGLVQLQKNSAVVRESTYTGWIDAGPSEFENRTLKAYQDAGEAQQSAAKANAVGQVASAHMASLPQGAVDLVTYPMRAVLAAVMSAAAVAEGVFNVRAIRAQTSAQVNSALASFERREQEWQLQQGLAALDVQIGDQQIVLAQNQIAIVQQERNIAWMEHAYAIDVLNFLLSKAFTEEMYRWIASVLEDVYRFFLQEATVIARLAERRLAFELQRAPLKVIQADYWNVPAGAAAATGSSADRLGLTGSARLLQDIYRVDIYAFDSKKLKQAFTRTLDLAAVFPAEFQRFRETGVLPFETSLREIDRQMPGYYLCLIQQVSVSVVALIPPIPGINATLTCAGVSRVVVGGDTFQTVTIRSLPERMALTAASTTSGPIALEPDSQSLLNPFEGIGYETPWELRMPKTANAFDYNSMATVLFTVHMTALHSFDYEREVIQRLDAKVSFDRAFDFRQAFPDPWYDLNNPDQTEIPMAVRFDTRRRDFPPNLANLAIQHVVLYLVRKDGEVFEQPIRHLHFTAEGMNGPVGGPASTVDGRVSTRSGNGTNWLPFIGQAPYGEWELAFPDTPPPDAEARDRFASELIENMLLVISVSGQTPAFPH